MVAGFNYDKLARGGVKCHSGKGMLKAENNMWTIANNITDDTDEIIPFLITRNLDPEYLLSASGEELSSYMIPLGKTWEIPCGSRIAVIIRKGGSMFKVRAKYATTRIIYNNQSFDANANSKYPLKYLTPTKEVIPIGKTE